MDREDRIPKILGGVGKGFIPQNSSVVDNAIDFSERIESSLQNPLTAFYARYVVVVGDAFRACRLDLIDDLVGHGVAFAAPVSGAPEIVDHDGGSFLRHGKRMFSADAATGSCDNYDFSVEQTH